MRKKKVYYQWRQVYYNNNQYDSDDFPFPKKFRSMEALKKNLKDAWYHEKFEVLKIQVVRTIRGPKKAPNR